MKQTTLSTLLILSFLTLIYSGCKSSLVSQEENSKTNNVIHKKLATLIEKDPIGSFYEIFNKNKFDPNHVEEIGTTLLFTAVSNDKLEVCEFLIKKGANVNFASEYGTVMHWALEKSNIKLANFLLDNDYDPKVEEKIKKNPEPLNFQCTFIIRKNKTEGIKLFKRLLDKGMNPNLLDRDGASAIHLAIYFESIELIKLLCEAGADMNLKIVSKKDDTNYKKEVFVTNQYTPLMLSVFYEKLLSTSELLKCNNVKTTIKSKDGKTAFDLAKENNNETLIKLLSNTEKE